MLQKIQTLQGLRRQRLVSRGAETASAAAFRETERKTEPDKWRKDHSK